MVFVVVSTRDSNTQIRSHLHHLYLLLSYSLALELSNSTAARPLALEPLILSPSNSQPLCPSLSNSKHPSPFAL